MRWQIRTVRNIRQNLTWAVIYNVICIPLTAMWMFAAASGSWSSGTASMFTFGMGTCVLMIFFRMFGKFIPKRYNKYITRVSTVLIVTLGLLLMTKGLKLL